MCPNLAILGAVSRNLGVASPEKEICCNCISIGCEIPAQQDCITWRSAQLSSAHLNVVAAAVVCFRYYLPPTPEGRMLMIGMLMDFVTAAPGAPPFAATVAAAAAHKQPPVRLAIPAPRDTRKSLA